MRACVRSSVGGRPGSVLSRFLLALSDGCQVASHVGCMLFRLSVPEQQEQARAVAGAAGACCHLLDTFSISVYRVSYLVQVRGGVACDELKVHPCCCCSCSSGVRDVGGRVHPCGPSGHVEHGRYGEAASGALPEVQRYSRLPSSRARARHLIPRGVLVLELWPSHFGQTLAPRTPLLSYSVRAFNVDAVFQWASTKNAEAKNGITPPGFCWRSALKHVLRV